MIKEHQRIGLVINSGCGKSRLFALLCGDIEVRLGKFRIIAYLAQEIPAAKQCALDYVLDKDR